MDLATTMEEISKRKNAPEYSNNEEPETKKQKTEEYTLNEGVNKERGDDGGGLAPRLKKMKDLLEKHECPICRQILIEPITVSCGHAMCAFCLEHLHDLGDSKCAVCGVPVKRRPFEQVSRRVPSFSELVEGIATEVLSPEELAARETMKTERREEIERRRTAAEPSTEVNFVESVQEQIGDVEIFIDLLAQMFIPENEIRNGENENTDTRPRVPRNFVLQMTSTINGVNTGCMVLDQNGIRERTGAYAEGLIFNVENFILNNSNQAGPQTQDSNQDGTDQAGNTMPSSNDSNPNVTNQNDSYIS